MMKKSIKKSCALLIACALTLSAFAVLPKANAANMVDTGKKDCSIDFKTGGDDKVSADLGTTTVDVKLYKVADISEVGDYTASGDFAQLDVSALDASDSTSADEWLKRATEAAGMVTDSTKPTAEVSLTDGEGKAEDLATGLYLVLADKAQTTNYEYTFTPYLISLPNNQYYVTGSDEWLYDTSTGLKPDQQERYGDLEIDKTLTSYNETMKGASFVFDIEAEVNGEIVYSDVVSMVFDGTGTKSVVIKELPAGANITVTEVYSGSSYEATGEAEQTTQIVADEMVSTAFENQYDGKLNGGSSVVNHFEFTPNEKTADDQKQSAEDGVWDWEQQTDSTQAQE